MSATKTLRVVAIIVGTCAFVGMFFQKQLVIQLKDQDSKKTTSSQRYMVEDEQIHENQGELRQQQPETSSTHASMPTGDTDPISFNAENPLFVLSLPNNGDFAIPRYFECGGYDSTKMGRRWTGNKPKKGGSGALLGDCMRQNLEDGNGPMLEGCGKPKHVYTDLQYITPPYLKINKPYKPPKCFDPVLRPGALEKLYEQYPKATIMNVVRDPLEWVQTLSKPFPGSWNEWCNPSHNNTFPSGQEVGQERAMAGFYLQYQYRIKQFIKEHPTWNYVEVDWDAETQVTGTHLQSQLGIPTTCWAESTTGTTHLLHDPKVPNVLSEQLRPNHIAWPMLVTAMPKAGTSTMHNYFNCGLGSWASAHQWTAKSTPPHKVVPIGECMIENTDKDVYPFLEGCGPSLVWSDTAVLRIRSLCYFPQFHRDGLERFYKSYPYGTILNTVRNTKSWVSSAFRWRDLPNRWVKTGCEGFPTSTNTTKDEWGEWYEGIQDHIRQFAREHPTLTYIEVPLGDHTGTMLNDIFRFPDHCWGHSNANKKNQEKPTENMTTSSAAQ